MDTGPGDADALNPHAGDRQRPVTLGQVTAAHGIRGWIKVRSDTSPRDNILAYSPWELVRDGQRRTWMVAEGRVQGQAVLARLEGCSDRDAAEALIGWQIQVPRERLPDAGLEPGEFYWADLVGLRVETLDGVALGHIERLFETGANDVIVVRGERERLIPYIWQQVVREVDLARGLMRVDWDPDF